MFRVQDLVAIESAKKKKEKKKEKEKENLNINSSWALCPIGINVCDGRWENHNLQYQYLIHEKTSNRFKIHARTTTTTMPNCPIIYAP